MSAPSTRQVLAAGALPPGPAYTKAGDGTFHMLPGTSKVAGSGTVYRYAIEVEGGIQGIDLQRYADLVQTTLSDPRSWAGHEWNGVHYALQRVDSGKIDFYVTLTSSYTVRKYCGYDVPVETSCYVRAGGAPGLSQNRVFLNDARWVRGARAYAGELYAYRIYMINHEDGHALGHMHAHSCLADGLAPAMMQQTYGLIDARTHRACKLNPWPYPAGASDAPGAEQYDTAANDELRLSAEYAH